MAVKEEEHVQAHPQSGERLEWRTGRRVKNDTDPAWSRGPRDKVLLELQLARRGGHWLQGRPGASTGRKGGASAALLSRAPEEQC